MPGVIQAPETATILAAAGLSVAGVVFALIAATVARRVATLARVAGGVLILLVALFHLAPEAYSYGLTERIFLVAGAAVGVGLEVAFRTRAHDSAANMRAVAWLGIILITIHSTFDGAVYTAVFWRADGATLFAALGLMLHEAPEGVAAMMLALQAGLRPAPAAGVAIFASSLTTPIGWGLGHLIGEAGNGVMQAMFAASAGLMIYVGWRLIAGGWRTLRAGRKSAAQNPANPGA